MHDDYSTPHNKLPGSTLFDFLSFLPPKFRLVNVNAVDCHSHERKYAHQLLSSCETSEDVCPSASK